MELCHAAYFIELWVLRRGAGREPCRADVDDLFDSMTIDHEARWRLPVPDRAQAVAYVREVHDRVLEEMESGLEHPRSRYWILYSVYHTDMHTEALTYTRHALGYRAPELQVPKAPDPTSTEVPGDISVAEDPLPSGSLRWPVLLRQREVGPSVDIEAFEIARTAVSEGEYLAFVMEGGYERAELWSPEGWAWRQSVQAELPLYWRRSRAGRLERRHFDRWEPLEERRAMVHVCWYEAQAYCRWAKRRLPSEAEWEAAAASDGPSKRTLPWGEQATGSELCNMDWSCMRPVDVSAYPKGDSPLRLPADGRQRLGVDRHDLPPLPGFRARHVQRLLADLLPYPQGVARGIVGHSLTPDAQHPAQLLPTWTKGRVRRFPHLCDPMSAPLDICIVTPAAPGSLVGNRVTAERWRDLLTSLGHRVQISTAGAEDPCDLLIAVHARRSAAAAARFRADHPERPLIVALSGTDLYRDIHEDESAQNSLEIADRLIVLHPRGAEDLPAHLRSRVRPVLQSVELPAQSVAKADELQVCVLAHMRAVKDPLRAAAAARLLPDSSRIRIVHVGAALDRDFFERARGEQAANPRYTWLGELPRADSLHVLLQSHLHVISSHMEGGSNALCEAIACGVPTLSSRIAGSVGILGEDYPGYFAVGDTQELADLLGRFETGGGFRETLAGRTRELAHWFYPGRERAALAELIAEVRDPASR